MSGAPILTDDFRVLGITCKYCNTAFDPTQQKLNLHGYCKPCCVDNHIGALRSQLKDLEKIQGEIYGEKYAYFKNMGWV